MTRQRLLTAAILIPIVVGADLYGPTWLIALLVAVVTALALREFFALGAHAGFPGHPRWTIFCGLFLIAAQYIDTNREKMLPSRPIESLLQGMIFVVFILGVILITLAGAASTNKGLPEVAISAGALLFVGWPMSFLVRIHGIANLGPQLLLFLLLVIWSGDSLAYVVGRKFGRHPMAPLTSPKKTWEGAVGNLVGSVLVALLAAFWIQSHGRYIAGPGLFAIAILANIAGQIGDLAESIYKRSAGEKDSGTLLPGHGGVLDRLDSLIFAAPVVWYYVSVVVQSYP